MATEFTTTSTHPTLETTDWFLRFADSVPLLMSLVDRDSNGIYFNQGWLKFTGRTQADTSGDRWLADISTQDLERFLGAFRKAVEAEDVFNVECRLLARNGKLHYFLITGKPHFGNEGQLESFVLTAVDLSQRKAMEHALRSSEVRSRALFGPSIGNVAVIDCAGQIIGLNDGWLQFARQHGGKLRAVGAGANYLEVCRRAMKLGIHEATLAHEGIIEVLAGSTPEFSLEYRCPTRSEELWFEMVVHPLHRPEGGAIVTHLNITNRRRAELQAQTLLHELAHVSRVAVLGELTAFFAHELSQPLTAIQTDTQAAKHMISESSLATGQLDEILSDILTENLRASKILQQLRALLKKDRAHFKPVKLNKLVRNVSDLLHDEAVLKKVKVSLHMDPSLPAVQGERIQLEQVILNLMINAFEAMRRNTRLRELTIETSVLDRDQAAIFVSDTGPGIPEERINQIFEPFFTTKTEGLGVGLAICRSIVELHGGKISVANNPGKGVTFSVVLPVLGKGNL